MSDDPLRDALALAAEYRTKLEALTEEHEAALAHAQVLESDLKERNEQLRVAVQELSTPVIEIWSGVLAVPLIGVIDGARGQQLIERVLGAVVRTGAAWVILDLTGVTAMDAGSADQCAALAKAVRMVGARCLLSGIGPALALTMLSLDVDRSLTTVRTLKEALDLCMSSSGGR